MTFLLKKVIDRDLRPYYAYCVKDSFSSRLFPSANFAVSNFTSATQTEPVV